MSSLNVEERAALQTAVVLKKHETGVSSVGFWGKVLGQEGDYLVVAVQRPTSQGVPTKEFFYCSESDFTLNALPALTVAQTVLAESQSTAPFTGVADAPAPQADAGEGEEPLTELHRLAYAVTAIEADTAVVPAGAFVVDSEHTVSPNPLFVGLNVAAAAKLGSYLHLRAPKLAATKAALAKNSFVDAGACLDSLASDTPTAAWSLQFNDPSTVATLRSLQWPGYAFSHTVGTSQFTSSYFGSGRPNTDLLFMV
jgi:radial spoke head protein 9|tara:strand:+ start:2009 stop:2770 length:762 start_codon:yes stop_codon:yes gene_type:complete